ncbi:ComEC/Rec2 family competence protein [Rugamonas rivuli]|uniref:MBL fold metallo-hydrolase n=1 Tax=Rugamonas rivuli TaxID=2743358 RepID=A0A843SBP4_9BURK|nr:MBL fold metallo-hydrolase [Rugamonas rivuli]MQA21649.1 MBL fold metallo-hydrolase [Rugamonas rivuli]
MSDFFEVKLIQAEHGDAILVSYGHSPVRHILVDGGPRQTLPYLLEVLSAACVAGSLTLEVIVVTHYDFDHIGGIIALLEEKPDWLKINDIWFNGHKHLLPRDLLGPRHSDALAKILVQTHLPWNLAFQENAVTTHDGRSVDLPGGMSIWILSPTEKELSALAKQWPADTPNNDHSTTRDRLGRHDTWPPSSFFSLVETRSPPDESASNAASIALLLKFARKQVLLSGDAHAEVIYESLATYWPNQVLKIDLLKVSHHGSQSNTSVALLNLIECCRFAISTNGKIHAHPDQAAIARVIGSNSNAELIFNYETALTARWQNRPPTWPRYRTSYPCGIGPFVRVTV